MIAQGVFDSDALNLRHAALDQAWAALPPDQRTAETRERIARAVVSLAMQWERDPADLGLTERAKISLLASSELATARTATKRRRAYARRILGRALSSCDSARPASRACLTVQI
jgi:hypothetical protein